VIRDGMRTAFWSATDDVLRAVSSLDEFATTIKSEISRWTKLTVGHQAGLISADRSSPAFVFVARPHVGMGVTKAALDAQGLVDALVASGGGFVSYRSCVSDYHTL
jgi:hypothetical protein